MVALRRVRRQRREHPLAEIVIFDEIAPHGGGQHPGIPHLFQRLLVRLAGPHLAAFGGAVEGVGGKRPLGGDTVAQRFDLALIHAGPVPGGVRGTRAEPPELALPEGIGLHRDQRGVMGEMLEQQPLLQ